MLVARCIIANLENGRFEWYARLTDEMHTFTIQRDGHTMTQQTAPKRDVECGVFKPPQASYASLRTARRSIDRYLPRINVRDFKVQRVTYEWPAGDKRKFVERKDIA